MINLPIYRAKKINSDEYVEGYYHSYIEDNIICNRIVSVGKPLFMFIDIDITTLAIHFPDMLDNQGNKIFASLSEDGKGGGLRFYGECI